MKKYFLYLSVILSLNTATFCRSHFLETLRLKIGNLVDTILGQGQDIEDKDIQLIEDLRQKMGIKHEVPVRNMNLFSRLLMGYTNAFAFSPGILDRVYLNKDWLAELSHEEKEFLFAHELAHVKNKDGVRRAIVAIIAKYCITPLSEKLIVGSPTPVSQKPIKYSLLTKIPEKLLFNTYVRYTEKQADMCAADLIQKTDGGIKLFTTMRKFEAKDPFYRKVQAEVGELVYLIQYLPIIKYFAEHPSYEERIEYLKKYKTCVN